MRDSISLRRHIKYRGVRENYYGVPFTLNIERMKEPSNSLDTGDYRYCAGDSTLADAAALRVAASPRFELVNCALQLLRPKRWLFPISRYVAELRYEPHFALPCSRISQTERFDGQWRL